MGRVSIVKCPDYAYEKVESAIRQCIDLLGGINKFVQPGQKVLLKINLLSATAPEKAVTTHPNVTLALARLVQEAGGQPIVADSPGPVPYTTTGLKKAYQAAGYLGPAERGELELNWDTAVQALPCPDGKLIKLFEVIQPVVACDVVIAVPKLKTHMFTSLTGATKILFGVIPGLAKAGYHAKLQSGEQFADMLLDIIQAVKPTLYLMDGILAMEGDGPGLHGNPRPLGLLMAADNPVSMDLAACSIIGLDPMEVPMLRAAKHRGWWSGGWSDIQVVGVPLSAAAVPDFRKPARVARDARGLDRLTWYQRMWAPAVKQALTPRPVPSAGRCTACATCRNICPQQAITIAGGVALVDDRNCIRCYCCHEVCPEAAIDQKFGPTGRLIRRFGLFGYR